MARKKSILILFTILLLVSAVAAKAQPPVAPDELRETITQHRGKVVVLNFWATWCAPCRIEIPDIMEVRDSFSEQDVFILGVSLDFNPEAPKQFIKQVGLNYPNVWASEEVMPAFNVTAIPKTMIWDRNGQLAIEHEGILDGETLGTALQRLVEE